MSKLSINFCPSKILTSIVLTEAKFHFRVRIQFKKMPVTLNKASLIIGTTGVLCAAAIVSIFGMSHVRWSFLMVVMAGSALFWMENLQRCIQAEVRREDRTHLVRVLSHPSFRLQAVPPLAKSVAWIKMIDVSASRGTLGATRTVQYFCGQRWRLVFVQAGEV